MSIHNDSEGNSEGKGRGRPYDCIRIEKKWQHYWETHKTFEVQEDNAVPKENRRYVLDMFPYPSAAGLHVGHPAGYTATDIYCRFLRMKGYHVLHPMGFDSFGLPAENYAIATKTHPRVSTEKNIERFTQQIKRLGFSYDWSRAVSTHTPEYYKWTQWLFLQLYKKGLAYQTKMPVWFCPEMGTVLANEEVLNTPEGPRSERGNHPVERRPLRQWLLKITAYADRLLQDLDTLEWPESVKAMQRNWIGRSEGAEIQFPIKDRTERISVFTTRPDTLWGATYMVLSPEHPLVENITTPTQIPDVRHYVQQTALKSDLERAELSKEKTGVFTGAYAINPVNNTPIPIWISDYVLMSYGTGAIMAVPAHDTRDFEFAKKFNLDIVEVIAPSQRHNNQQSLSEAYTKEGVLINSDMFNGYDSRTAKKDVITWLETNNIGSLKVNYKLHDWIFSRQRYWGEPIPVIHMEDGSVQPLDESELPLTLPIVESYTPTGTGESPLANIDTWCNITTADNKKARRETNTMPQWAGSCWYYLRYTDPHNNHQFASKEKLAYWLPVDLYIGGAEHAVLHLLYARFWHKVLYDLQMVPTPEPFVKLINQGMILGGDGNKMSKSIGNVINPDEVIDVYGADSFRLYEMFMGPLTQEKPWSTKGLAGAHRFLNRTWRLTEKPLSDDAPPDALNKILNKSIKKITHDTETLSFNTAIAQMMIMVNEMNTHDVRYKAVWQAFVIMLAPYVPHLAEELWEQLGNITTISYEPWPTYDETLTVDDIVEVVLQINGKVRARIDVERGTPQETLKTLALNNEKAQQFIGDASPQKIIVVADKLVNIVI